MGTLCVCMHTWVCVITVYGCIFRYVVCANSEKLPMHAHIIVIKVCPVLVSVLFPEVQMTAYIYPMVSAWVDQRSHQRG